MAGQHARSPLLGTDGPFRGGHRQPGPRTAGRGRRDHRPVRSPPPALHRPGCGHCPGCGAVGVCPSAHASGKRIQCVGKPAGGGDAGPRPGPAGPVGLPQQCCWAGAFTGGHPGRDIRHHPACLCVHRRARAFGHRGRGHRCCCPCHTPCPAVRVPQTSGHHTPRLCAHGAPGGGPQRPAGSSAWRKSHGHGRGDALGFSHSGRFASQYRAVNGCLPSAALRRPP